MTVGVIMSVPEEGRLFVRRLAPRAEPTVGLQGFSSGLFLGVRVVLAFSGIGKVNAAHAATLLINRFSPSILLNIGVAGAYPASGLKVGDLAVAQEEVYGDEGVVDSDGFSGMEKIGIPFLMRGRKKFFNVFPLHRKLSAEAYAAARSVGNAASGTFVTVSHCSGSTRRAEELGTRFGGLCENMEGAAVAHICARYGLPMAEFRGISNIAGLRDKDTWNLPLAAEICQEAALHFLGAIR